MAVVLALAVVLLAGCGGSHKRLKSDRPATSYASPGDNIYISSGLDLVTPASPPSLPVLKQYVITWDDLSFANVQESASVQVVKVPGVGRCVIVSTGGVWCK